MGGKPNIVENPVPGMGDAGNPDGSRRLRKGKGRVVESKIASAGYYPDTVVSSSGEGKVKVVGYPYRCRSSICRSSG